VAGTAGDKQEFENNASNTSVYSLRRPSETKKPKKKRKNRSQSKVHQQ